MSGRGELQVTNRVFQVKILFQLCAALMLAGILWVSPLGSSSVYADEVIYHVVRPGESLSSIARKYGVNYMTLARYNGIRNANLLRVGQRLRIPVSGSISPSPTPVATRKASPATNATTSSAHGSTSTTKPTATARWTSTSGSMERPYVGASTATAASTVSKTTSKTTRTPIAAPTREASTSPMLRTATPTPAPRIRIHTVQRFETLSSIAARYGVTVYAIMRRNRLPNDRIYAGQSLIIPIQ